MYFKLEVKLDEATSHKTSLSLECGLFNSRSFILVHKNGPGTHLHRPRAHNSFITKNISSPLDLMIKSLQPRESGIVDDTIPVPPA